MPQIRIFALAFFTFVGLALPLGALANTKCLCNNGAIVQSMDDDATACEDACEELGGGRAWTPEDAGIQDEEVDESGRREPAREQPPARLH
jgi:hypothetical protein